MGQADREQLLLEREMPKHEAEIARAANVGIGLAVFSLEFYRVIMDRPDNPFTRDEVIRFVEAALSGQR